MPATDVPNARLDPQAAGSLVAAIQQTNSLVHITVNVGDGDCQLLVLPADDTGQRHLMIVDTIRADKLLRLIDDLNQAGVLGPGGAQVELVVATHPHADHIRGIPRVLDTFAASRPEVWEPGYRHQSGMYLDILDRVARHGLRRTVVSAGMMRFFGQTRITVLSPGVSLQHRFDSYGVDVNNASVCLKIDYPATQVIRTVVGMEMKHTFVDHDIGTSLVLGADAQMLSWAQVLVDFPQLAKDPTPAREAIRISGGTMPLKADIFKVPHHGSKHGLTLELVSAIAPKVSIVSSVHSGGSYHFPHEVAMLQLREAVNARATKPGVPFDPDEDLRLLYTGSNVNPGGSAAGSVCVICQVGGQRQVWRLMDKADANIDLDDARLVN
jgi:beta-lactamase superfamily II metal-dependent hydrolase